MQDPAFLALKIECILLFFSQKVLVTSGVPVIGFLVYFSFLLFSFGTNNGNFLVAVNARYNIWPLSYNLIQFWLLNFKTYLFSVQFCNYSVASQSILPLKGDDKPM